MGPNYNDEQLVELLKKDDEFAISEIYERYWDKLLSIAYNHSKDKAVAQEIVQEVLIKLWDRRKSLQIESLPNYLAMSIRYAVSNNILREKRRNEIAHEIFGESNLDFDDEKIYAQFLKEYINGVVEKLPDKCKLIFKFSREKGKSNREIAFDLSLSEKAVEANITKALKAIRLSLKNSSIFLLTFLL